MPPALWHLIQNRADLTLGELSAALELGNPAPGLVDLAVSGAAIPGATILVLAVPRPAQPNSDLSSECYVRGADLVAVLEQSEGWPFRVDAVWRTRPEEPVRSVATLEMLVSVRTSLLDGQPELAVQTVVPAEEVLHLTDPQSGRYETLTAPAESPLIMEPTGGPGCLLLRLVGGCVSYAEMIHPADHRGVTLRQAADGGGLVQVGHPLFPPLLEKGVLLRARLRGVFLPRDHDARLAAEHYRTFAADEPPLGT